MWDLTPFHFRTHSWDMLPFLTSLFLCLVVSSCAFAPANSLNTGPASPSEVVGTYTLLLYGCRYPDDLENVAILAREGVSYTFDIYALPTRYRMTPNLPADRAVKAAGRFVSCGVHYQKTRFSKIFDATGTVIGYEVRPLYSPIRFGMDDVLHIRYVNKAGKIVVYIRLDPTVENEMTDAGGHDRHRGR